jgi:hypothetical protein
VAMVYDIPAGLIEGGVTESHVASPTAPGAVQSAYLVGAEICCRPIDKVESPSVAVTMGLSVALMRWAMRKGVFDRSTADLGFAVGAVSIGGGSVGVFPLLLMAEASHEPRTPLTAIRGYACALLHDRPTGRRARPAPPRAVADSSATNSARRSP